MEVYYSPPCKLNDPFEFKPNIVMPSEVALKTCLEAKGIRNNNFKALISKNMKMLRENIPRVKNVLEELSEKAGVFCLTPHFDNLLMWSHYGDSHKGICVGFDIEQPIHDNDPVDPVFGLGVDVEYLDAYPEICMTEIINGLSTYTESPDKMSGYNEMVARILYAKGQDWSYENEVRFCNINLGFSSGLVSFPASKLKEIILGSKIDPTFEEKTIEYAINNFPHAVVKKAKISTVEYKLDFKTISIKSKNANQRLYSDAQNAARR